MLVILSGTDSIGKRFIAKRITTVLNTFESNGHEFDVTTDEMIGGVDKVIRDDTLDDDLSNVVLQDVVGLRELAMNEIVESNYKDLFTSVGMDIATKHNYDHDCEIPWEWDEDPARVGKSYQDIITRYENRTFDTFVIYGNFGITFLNQIIGDLGEDNVAVYNIVRHPAVAYVLDTMMPAEEYDSVNNSDNQRYKDWFMSVSNTVLLSQDPRVTTIKFEDVVRNQSLEVCGVDVGVHAGYEVGNRWLTSYELDNIAPKVTVNGTVYNRINRQLRSWTFADQSFDDGDSFDAVTDTVIGTPWNVLEELDYETIAPTEILANQS